MPIQYTEAVTIIGEYCRIRRFEIRIQAIAANIESTTNRSPYVLARTAPEEFLLDSAIKPAPMVEAASASQPPKCNCSRENNTAATARSMGSVATIREACETVVRESPLNWTRYWTGTPSTDAARTQPHSFPLNRGWSKKTTGSNPAQANANRNKTVVATGISSSATLPKKNPVPQRQPAVVRARMGKKRPRSLSIRFDSNGIDASGCLAAGFVLLETTVTARKEIFRETFCRLV